MLPPLVIVLNFPIADATVKVISDELNDLSSETGWISITFAAVCCSRAGVGRLTRSFVTRNPCSPVARHCYRNAHDDLSPIGHELELNAAISARNRSAN
jgi:hypothetical protein